MATVTAPVGFGRSAWTAIRHGQQMNGIGLNAVSIMMGGDVASFGEGIFVAPPVLTGGNWKVEAAAINIPDELGDWPVGDAANHWELHLRAPGGNLDTVGGINNNGALLVVDTTYAMPIQGPESTDPQNVFLEAGDVVSFEGQLFGTGQAVGNLDLSNQVFYITLYLRQTPPGR